MKFITACFHPNVDENGFICLDILKDKWSALYDVRSILLSIQSLLGGGFCFTVRNKVLVHSQFMSYLNLIGHDLQDVYLKLNKSFSLIQVLQQYDFISFGSAYL